MNRQYISITLLTLAFFFLPVSVYADSTASDSASCSFLDVGCQVCFLFCLDTTFATDEYNSLVASIAAKAPFAYVSSAFNFNTSSGDTFYISSLTFDGSDTTAHLKNIPYDPSINACHLHVWDPTPAFGPPFDVGFSAGGFDTATDSSCSHGSSPASFNDDPGLLVSVELDTNNDTIVYQSPKVPYVFDTNFQSPSEEVLPLTITLATISAIPAIGMPEEAGMTYTVTDNDHKIHDLLFNYIRPSITFLLWLMLIGYFVLVADRIFN